MNSKGGDAAEKTSPSGIPVKAVYHPADADVNYSNDLGEPGEWPFTRGVQPTMYRGRLWTMRQYAGFGTAAESNRRYHYLLSRGVFARHLGYLLIGVVVFMLYGGALWGLLPAPAMSGSSTVSGGGSCSSGAGIGRRPPGPTPSTTRSSRSTSRPPPSAC